MKVLLVSWYFPPANTIAAVRLGNLARHLIGRGHDVRVLAAKDLPYQQSLTIELPEDRIVYTKWADVNAAPQGLTRVVKKLLGAHRAKAGSTPAPATDPGTGPQQQAGAAATASSWFTSLYENIFNWPDSRVGWLPFAVRAGKRLLTQWTPDVVFASAPPFTTLLVGHILSRRYGLPLVVEFRDRWHDDPYYPPPPWRRWVDRTAERYIVQRAVAIATVSEPWAKTYRERYGKPVAVIYNGFDERLRAPDGGARTGAGGLLRIVYTGGIYPGRRDPTPLFAALRSLGDEAESVRVEFFGTNPALVLPLAERQEVAHLIVVHPPIPHQEAVVQQRRADVLLLMQWNDPREQGNVPGKFFEYLGVLRPILVLGLNDGVPATIVRERGVGFFSNDPDALAAKLREWIKLKRELGHIPPLPEKARRGFCRDEQFAKLENFLSELIRPQLQAAPSAQPVP